MIMYADPTNNRLIAANVIAAYVTTGLYRVLTAVCKLAFEDLAGIEKCLMSNRSIAVILYIVASNAQLSFVTNCIN